MRQKWFRIVLPTRLLGYVLAQQCESSWSGASTLGFVNLTFVKDSVMDRKREGTMETRTPLYELPVIDLADVSVAGNESMKDSSYEIRAIQTMLAGGIRGGSTFAGVADMVFRQVARVRQKLGDQFPRDKFRNITHLINHVDHITDELLTAKLPASEAEAVMAMESAWAPLVEFMKEHVVQHLLQCPLERLRCPKFVWYGRLFNIGHFSTVHNDGGFMFGVSRFEEFAKIFEANMDDWITVWMLLSESLYDKPVVMMDRYDIHPMGHDPHQPYDSGRLNPWVWPPRDLNSTYASCKASDTGSMKAYTFGNMQRGDMMFWRTTKVPHGAGKADWNHPTIAEGLRSSFDMQCVCGGLRRKQQRSATGELCREVWRRSEQIVHGCANPDGDPKGPHCQIEREHTGGAGFIKRDRTGKRARYDYCAAE